MAMYPQAPSAEVELDVRLLFKAVLRALPYIIVITIICAVALYYALSRISPLYKSEATVLIETGESELTRPQTGVSDTSTFLAQEAVASQVQLIRSRDLARTVAAKLDLASRPEFDPALKGGSFVTRLLARFGLAKDPLNSTAEERVLERFAKRLDVYAIDKSRVIVIDFSSTDPKLAAAAANAVADEYLSLQRAAKRETTVGATKWLEAEIGDLRSKVKDAEAKVESFRSGNDLFTNGSQTPATLPQQQLADLNTELAKVRAARADAEAKAAQIRSAIAAGNAASQVDVLNSPLIQRLVEQQVALRTQMAQLSATLLPGHPKMKEMSAQIADLDRQIAAEGGKILDALEAEAKLAEARETEIQKGLGEFKAAASRANDAEVQLRALEREAAAQRDLLDTYLRQYREALSRQKGDYLPADARVISRAAVTIEPDFPKKGPMTAVGGIAIFLLLIAIVLIRELASGRPVQAVSGGMPIPAVPGAMPVDARARWADDSGVRRMMPGMPVAEPSMIDRVEESLASIAGEIASSAAGRVLVTLAEGSDRAGRPLAAVALGRALARADRRTVLIDLRGDGANAASMGEASGLPGFFDLFAGKASFAQSIFRDRRSRLHFIPAGRDKLAPAQLDAERLETILSALDHTYDHVIVDAADEMIGLVGPTAKVAVVVSEFGSSDPRTVAAFDRVTAASSANILLLLVEPKPGSEGEASTIAAA
jgi:exopolysaccharide transport family protein